MALTELQLPDKVTFYAKLQRAATQMDTVIGQWRNIAEFISFVDTADLDAMGVATGQVRTDLINFRTALAEMIAFYDGTAMTQTNVPGEVMDKIRTM